MSFNTVIRRAETALSAAEFVYRVLSAAPQPAQATRTPLEQYDLDQSPEYRKGYQDGRLKGYEVGHRHASEWAGLKGGEA